MRRCQTGRPCWPRLPTQTTPAHTQSAQAQPSLCFPGGRLLCCTGTMQVCMEFMASLIDVHVNYKDGATPFSGVGKDMSAGASWDQDGLAPVVGDSSASARSLPVVRCIGLSLHRLLSAGGHAGRSALGHPVSADRQQCGVRWPQLAQAAECSLVPSGSWATTSWPHPW